MVTFACVLRVDEDNQKKQPVPYDKEWVNKLHRAVQRNYQEEHRFVCLSNVETDVETVPLITDWKGWWSKVELFRPDVFQPTERVIYLDLDVLICKDFTGFFLGFNYRNFHMLREPDGTPNSSMMYWRGDYSKIWDVCSQDPDGTFSKYWKKNNPVIGDQGLIADLTEPMALNDYPVDPYFCWRGHKGAQEFKDQTFFIFTSKDEKPYNRPELEVVRKHWI